MNAYTATQVGQQLLNVAGPLTPMQVLKLVYLCHGWMLGLHGRPLIQENVMAWQYGPIIRELYNAVRHYRNDPISTDALPLSADRRKVAELEEDLINQVYNCYKHLDGMQLSTLTHAEGTPWHSTWGDGRNRNRIIPIDTIRKYFEELAARNSAS